MEMMQYRPWEKNEVNGIISKVGEGQLPILDIQLGGGCNNQCEYCDTPRYGEPCRVNLDAVERILGSQNIQGVYVCGLGEPTQCQNIRYLKNILAMCEQKGIWVSMFTNLINLDDQLLDYIDNGTLNILFKLDTTMAERAKRLYGQPSDFKISKHFTNIERVLEVTHAQNGITNVGASIVPTSVNYDELEKIIRLCLAANWFPLIGQLECAGMCRKVFDELKLSKEQLNEIRNWLLNTYGIDYQMPTCSATISGIHITNCNKVIVDERTGLSCPWFWLDEPELEVIGDINEMSYDEIVQRILEYRASKYEDVCRMRDNIESYPFGGCGGDVRCLLKTYTEVYQPKR